MNAKDIKRIRINKNRGWRGLSELDCEDEKGHIIHKMIFSFSQAVWNDMLKGYIVTQDEDNYFILNFNNTENLPEPTQQRSVLIKSFEATVISVTVQSKDVPLTTLSSDDFIRVWNFKKNKNNHTMSDWNCIRFTCSAKYINKLK